MKWSIFLQVECCSKVFKEKSFSYRLDMTSSFSLALNSINSYSNSVCWSREINFIQTQGLCKPSRWIFWWTRRASNPLLRKGFKRIYMLSNYLDLLNKAYKKFKINQCCCLKTLEFLVIKLNKTRFLWKMSSWKFY